MTTTTPEEVSSSTADEETRELTLAMIAAAREVDAKTKLPKKLSPSRASAFMKCPQKFWFETIAGIKSGGSLATLRGTLAHYACEMIFDHPAGERTLELALPYVEQKWRMLLEAVPDNDSARSKQYAEDAQAEALTLVTPGSEDEAELLESARECVRLWFNMERVNNFTPKDLELPNGRKIDGRELYLMAQLAGVTVNGFVDRLDRYVTPDGKVRWSITDYKSSAVAPWLKKPYKEETVARIRDENFFQLLVYAVLAWKMFGIRVSMLRLVYIGNGDREAGIQAETVTQAKIDRTIVQLENIWRDINTACETGNWPTKQSKLCDFCHVKDFCPAFAKA